MPNRRPKTDSLPPDHQALVAALQIPWGKIVLGAIAVIGALWGLSIFLLQTQFLTVAKAEAAQAINTAEHKAITKLVADLVGPIRENAKNIEINDKEDEHQNESLKRLERQMYRFHR